MAPIAIAIINYQSATAASHGVPMTIGAMRLERLALLTDEAYRHAAAQLEVAAVESGVFGDYKTTDRDRFVSCVLGMSSYSTKTVGMLLNIPERSVAALRAHATRGTYERLS